jgi:hypothetical protein
VNRPSALDDSVCTDAKRLERKVSHGSVGNAPPFSQAGRANGDLYVDALPSGGHRIASVFRAPLS